MQLQELLNGDAKITLQVTAAQLREFADYLIQKTISEKQLQPTGEQYLSPAKVCELLDIDNTTLWRWDKKGLLHPIKLGGVNRYKQSDIERVISGK